ncbi:hypothetical protein F5887DRAFT_1010460 [Amanita rubescens]|nr:hypothetical protein F5887DRAFT_1042590 [Amanita rubescens]KAF8327636.1 hypothetical protein F5887DRAFT_1010460 [Amanita rubescens]
MNDPSVFYLSFSYVCWLDYYNICSIMSNKEKRQCTQNGSNIYKKTSKTPMMRNLVIVYTFKVAVARSSIFLLASPRGFPWRAVLPSDSDQWK